MYEAKSINTELQHQGKVTYELGLAGNITHASLPYAN